LKAASKSARLVSVCAFGTDLRDQVIGYAGLCAVWSIN
jgi:hypothetical protein